MKFNCKKALKGVIFLMKNRDNISLVIVFVLGLRRFVFDDNFVSNLIDVILVIMYFSLNIFYNIED
jgi:hypothetical protein